MFCTSLDFMVQQRPPRTCTDWKSASVLSPVPNDIKADFSLFINTNYLSLQRQCEAHTGRTLCLFCFLKLIMNRPVHSEHKLVWGLEGWFPAGPKKVVFSPDANYDVISGRIMLKTVKLWMHLHSVFTWIKDCLLSFICTWLRLFPCFLIINII